MKAMRFPKKIEPLCHRKKKIHLFTKNHKHQSSNVAMSIQPTTELTIEEAAPLTNFIAQSPNSPYTLNEKVKGSDVVSIFFSHSFAARRRNS